jgi:hypothetical protein
VLCSCAEKILYKISVHVTPARDAVDWLDSLKKQEVYVINMQRGVNVVYIFLWKKLSL